MGKVTIEDIAQIAGVTKGTVSKVINGTGRVSEETRAKINKIIEENGYSPSALARWFSKSESSIIGVILPEISSPFFASILKGINKIADERNYNVVICNSDDNFAKEKKALEMLYDQRVKGIIMNTSIAYNDIGQRKELTDILDQMGIPVVLVDRAIKNSKWDAVFFDNFNGAYLATENLINAGYKKIGTILADQQLKLGEDRFSGFCQALDDYGVTLDSKWVSLSPRGVAMEEAYRTVLNMVDSGNLPEAIFLGTGSIAKGCLKALFERKIILGEDICCVGVDYLEILKVIDIKYNYLDRETVKMGELAMELLQERFEEKGKVRKEVIIPAVLVKNGL